jgi:hypothetical protein
MERIFFTSSDAKMGRYLLNSASCTDLFLTIGPVAWEQFGLTDPTAYVSFQFPEMDLLLNF